MAFPQAGSMKQTGLSFGVEGISHQNSAASCWSRRRFLRTAGLAGLAGPALVSCRVPDPHLSAISANSKLNHACIGVGGMGWGDLQEFLKHPRAQIVALCDVAADHLNQAAKAVPGARR